MIPISFSGEMVRAILGGKKTQTRRVIRPQPSTGIYDLQPISETVWRGKALVSVESFKLLWNCPHGKPGDTLYVREGLRRTQSGLVVYAADGCPAMRDGESVSWGWKRSGLSGCFMPGWAARIFLCIEAVRAEQVQEITEADAVAEGVCPIVANKQITSPLYRDGFAVLWDTLRGYSWAANPWVFVIRFKVLSDNARRKAGDGG